MKASHPDRRSTAEHEELHTLTERDAELNRQAQAPDDTPERLPDEAELIDLENQDIAARQKAIGEALKT